MTGKQWIESFLDSLYEHRQMANRDDYNEKPSKWTEFMVENVIKKGIEHRLDCYVVCCKRHKSTKQEERDSGEYLNIDAMVFNKSDYKKPVYVKIKNTTKYDPRVLPAAIIEHENEGSNDDKIAHCLWKLLCIRSQLRVLICYHNNISRIKKILEDTILDGGLAEGLMGELFVIIGDRSRDEALWETQADIKNYFSIFQWDNNQLKRFPES